MKIVFLGPPGAGKGTQAARLCGRMGVPHISTGDMLRGALAAGTEIGLEAKSFLDRGALVSDEVIARIVRERLGQDDCSRGFVLDGFPRTIRQAELLDEAVGSPALDVVVLIDVPEEELVRRLTSRGEGRSDDKPEVIEHRLSVYANETAPLREHYDAQGLLVVVDGNASMDAVTLRVSEAVEQAVLDRGGVSNGDSCAGGAA